MATHTHAGTRHHPHILVPLAMMVALSCPLIPSLPPSPQVDSSLRSPTQASSSSSHDTPAHAPLPRRPRNMNVLQHAEEEVTAFFAHRQLRVAVVPLGGLPDARFRTYLSLLRRFTELPMANLSKPGSWKKEKSPFKHFSWFDGSLLLQYLDRAPGLAVRPSEWQDFQAFRRTWAVIGVVHLPSCAPGAVRGIEAEFQERLKGFPHAVARKVFCFGHSFGENAVGADSLETAYGNKEELVIFPPEGDHVDSGMSMVELHMGVMLNDVAVMVLSHLEEEVAKTRASKGGGGTGAAGGGSGGGGGGGSGGGGSTSSGKALAKRGGQWLAGLRSPFDDEASASGDAAKKGSGSTGVGANQGRMSKWVGDLCLLAGTPQDALEAYAAAIGECKTAADPLWQAGSLEGWVAALDVVAQWHLPLDEILGGGGGGREMLLKGDSAGNAAKNFLKEVEDKATEALALLEPQGAPHAPLAVGLCFKMARFHGAAQPTPRHVEALAYVMRAMAVAGLGMPQQVLRSLEAASTCKWLGLERKYAFLLRLAAIQSSELQSPAAALALARVAAGAYGVTFLDKVGGGTTAEPLPNPSPPRRDIRAIYPPPAGGWPCLQKHLLSDLVAFSTAAKNVPAACGYYLSLLHLFAELEESRQRARVLLGGAGGGGGGGGGGGETGTLALTGQFASNSSTGEPGSPGGISSSSVRPLPRLESSEADKHQRQWSENSLGGTVSDDDDAYEDDDGLPTGGGGGLAGGRPLSSERWQIRGGMRGLGGTGGKQGSGSGATGEFSSFSSGGGGLSALKFSFSSKNRTSMLKPFSGGSGKNFYRTSASLGGESTSDGAVSASDISSPERTSSMGSTGGGGGLLAAAGGDKDGSLLSQNVAPSPEEQEAVIMEMMKLTRRLPPRTVLDIHGFPTVHFVRPLRLPRDVVPFMHKVAAGVAATGAAGANSPFASVSSAPSSPSAFIYNPFADKGGQGGPSVTWAAGEVAHVALSLSNPLGAPLNIQSIELLVEAEGGGGEGEKDGGSVASSSSSSAVAAFCYPLTLWVPAYQRHHPLTLAVKPLQAGGLVIRGVKMTVFNITSKVLVDVHGNGPVSTPRSAPRDWYPRQAMPYLRTPKGREGGGKKGSGASPSDLVAARGGGGGAVPPEHSVATNKVAVVAPLPCLTTKLDRWATNVELFPGEYRRALLELQVTNEVSIGFLEISVHQKALTKKAKAAGRPVTLYTFGESGELGHHQHGDHASSPSFHHHQHHHRQQPHQQPYNHEGGEWLSVALDPLGLETLTSTLQTALATHACLSSLSLPLLFRRVDRYPEADIFVKYSTHASHRHFRTLTIPLRFHLKEGLATTDLAVETSAIHIYPALARVIEAAHRGVWEDSPSPVRRRFKGGMDMIDTDHDACFLLAEVHNAAAEDLHIKTCLLEDEEAEDSGKAKVVPASPPPTSPPRSPRSRYAAAAVGASHTLCSEVNLLQDLSAPTTVIVRPKASRRVIIPFTRLNADSPLLKAPPPPPPPPGGGQAPKPTITLDSPEWTRALHGLCRSLRMQWADRYGMRSGLLRLSPTLASSVKPVALERLKLPLLRMSCSVGSPAQEEEGGKKERLAMKEGDEHVRSPLLRCKSASSSFTILQPLAFPQHLASPGMVLTQGDSLGASAPGEGGGGGGGGEGGGGGGGGGEEDDHGVTTLAAADAQTFPPYAFIPIHFRVTNRSSSQTLPSTKCFAHTYQDYGNGNLNFAIDSIRAMWSGSVTWVTPLLLPGESYLHVAYVSFTASGVYGVGMSASYLPEPGTGGSGGGLAWLKGGGGGGGGEGPEPLLYWGHEAQVLVIGDIEEGGDN